MCNKSCSIIFGACLSFSRQNNDVFNFVHFLSFNIFMKIYSTFRVVGIIPNHDVLNVLNHHMKTFYLLITPSSDTIHLKVNNIISPCVVFKQFNID